MILIFQVLVESGERLGGRGAKCNEIPGGRSIVADNLPGQVVQTVDGLDHILPVSHAPPVLIKEPVQRPAMLHSDGNAQSADDQQDDEQPAKGHGEFLP